MNQQYKCSPSICFIVNKPVKREIFAAHFRDRVIHHLLFNYIVSFFEKEFLSDAYSCRKNKGVHYGVKRLNHFINKCSADYTKDAYILKLDIRSYFMSMNKSILFHQVKKVLIKNKNYLEFDLKLVLSLLKETIYNDPKKNCIFKGNPASWEGLPPSKSLFHASENCGLPIGNLTSQLFGNVYLNEFDHWVKKQLKIKYYGRYVDDFFLVHHNKNYLKACIPKISNFLSQHLQLTLHPHKIYLQHFSKGVSFLGTVIKPYRIYIGNRTKGNFYLALQRFNALVNSRKPTDAELNSFCSVVNSYLGLLQHYNTYKLRKKMLQKELSGYWFNYIYIKNNFKMIVPKSQAINLKNFKVFTYFSNGKEIVAAFPR